MQNKSLSSLGTRPAVFSRNHAHRPQPLRWNGKILAADKPVAVVSGRPKWHGDNGISIPVTDAQVLGLRGRSLYLEAQITMAYEEQLSSPLDEGYSDVALLGKEKLLHSARDGVKAARGRVSNMHLEQTIEPILLPGAMALLEKGGFYDLVIQLSQQAMALDERDLKASSKDTALDFQRDVALATALAHCGLAHQALKKGQVALGCGRLEEALQILKDASSGSSKPLAADLQARIEAALADFKADAVLNYLQGPLNLEGGASLRPQAVAALSVMLTRPETAARSDGSQPITAEYVTTALDALTSDEIVGLMDWDHLALHKTTHSWYHHSVLPLAGLAHIVSGFVHRRPSLIATARRLLAHAGAESDVAIHQAICALLLGATREALEIIKEDDAIGAALRGTTPRHQTPRGPISFPARDDILHFIRVYSPDGDSDLTPGLCVFAEAWLARLAFTRFRDTRQHVPSPSVAAYLDDPQVMAGLTSHAVAMSLPSLNQLKGSLSRQTLQTLAVGGAAALGLLVFIVKGGFAGSRGNGGVTNTVTSGSSGGTAATAVKPAAAAVGGKLSTLSVPSGVELTRDVVRHIVEQWLSLKADAMGPRHKTNQLPTVLAEPMLSAVRAESEEAAESGWFWNIRPLKVKIEKIDLSGLNANGKGGQAMVLATVEESADLWASNGRKGDSYRTTYKVEYTLARANGNWKISSAVVLGR